MGGQALFEQALVELGCPAQDEATSAETLNRWLADCVLSGALAPEDACAVGARFYFRTGYTRDAFLEWYAFDADYKSVRCNGTTYWGTTKTEFDEAVRAAAREFIAAPEHSP